MNVFFLFFKGDEFRSIFIVDVKVQSIFHIQNINFNDQSILIIEIYIIKILLAVYVMQR